MSDFALIAVPQLRYPRFYFDFEGIDLAIPVWEGVQPTSTSHFNGAVKFNERLMVHSNCFWLNYRVHSGRSAKHAWKNFMGRSI